MVQVLAHSSILYPILLRIDSGTGLVCVAFMQAPSFMIGRVYALSALVLPASSLFWVCALMHRDLIVGAMLQRGQRAH